MSSTHLFSLGSIQPQKVTSYGSRSDATVENFPILKGMSLSHLKIAPHGVREPHWHPNAHELSYCLKGRGLMTVFNPGFDHETFVIEPGTLSFVPRGSLHHIENCEEEPMELLICFDHEAAEDINLSSAVSVMPPHILGATFHLNAQSFEHYKKTISPVFIGYKQKLTPLDGVLKTNRLRMNIEELHPQISTPGGWVKMSNSFLMPSLDGLAMYSLLLDIKGVREPHWHPNAHELNYLMSGRARITILSPDGSVETFEMKEGDISFLPRGYFHHIENRGETPARFLIFFNHKTPSDIGLTGSFGAYSNDILSMVCQVPLDQIEKLPKYQEDLFVVAGGG